MSMIAANATGSENIPDILESNTTMKISKISPRSRLHIASNTRSLKHTRYQSLDNARSPPVRPEPSSTPTDNNTGNPPLKSARNAIQNNEEFDWSHPLTKPLYLIRTNINTIFVRHEVMLQIPYFARRVEDGEITPGNEYDMSGPEYYSPSMCLLFDLAEKDMLVDVSNNPHWGPDVDLLNAEVFLRAYALAGDWGLEKFQNWTADKLVGHYLVHTVPPEDIGILLRLGLIESNLCEMLTKELACGLLNGENLWCPQSEDGELRDGTVDERIQEEHPNNVEDDTTSAHDGNTTTNILSDNDEAETGQHAKPIRSSRDKPTSLPTSHNNSNSDAVQDNSSTTPASPNSSSPHQPTLMDPTSDKNALWKQIQTTWSLAGCTTLMAMMVDVHRQERNPIARSPLELAASDPCICHVHTGSDICYAMKKKESMKYKRKRATSRSDTSGEEDNNDDDVYLSDTDVVEVGSSGGKETEVAGRDEDKENTDPNDTKNEKITARTKGSAKKRRIWEFLGR